MKTKIIASMFLILISIGFSAEAKLVCPPISESTPKVSRPPKTFNAFYKKYINAKGIAIVASENTCDRSLQVTYEIVDKMLSMRPDIRARLASKNFIAVFGAEEKMTDLPEERDLAGVWVDPVTKTRKYDDLCGGGGIQGRPTTICERNLIGYQDPYFGKMSILIHEFGHTIQDMGLDESTRAAIENEYAEAKKQNLYPTQDDTISYMMSNVHEFFAESTGTWFSAAYPSNPACSPEETNREHMAEYAPRLYKLMSEIYPNDNWDRPRK